jgi:hypothetical protein
VLAHSVSPIGRWELFAVCFFHGSGGKRDLFGWGVEEASRRRERQGNHRWTRMNSDRPCGANGPHPLPLSKFGEGSGGGRRVEEVEGTAEHRLRRLHRLAAAPTATGVASAGRTLSPRQRRTSLAEFTLSGAEGLGMKKSPLRGERGLRSAHDADREPTPPGCAMRGVSADGTEGHRQ